MKGAYILLEKNGVLMRTQFVDRERVRWVDGDLPLIELTHNGYVVVHENLLMVAIKKVEDVRDRLCRGVRVKNEDLLDIISLLKDY